MKASEPMVRIHRGPITECIHRGHAAVVSAKNELLYEWGDAHLVTFARSTAKLIQALPVLESGAANRFGFTEAEIALLCASHSGEAEHVSAVLSVLTKLGRTADDLQCGVHEPYHKASAEAMRKSLTAPTSLHNNCSGKHAGMLALAVHQEAALDNYLSIDHPVQQRMLEAVSAMSGAPREQIHLGIDGCGVPVFGMGIHQLALAYARLGRPDGLPTDREEACRRLIAAIRKHPYYLAGSERFDTALIQATNGRIIGKMGAEGVFALTVPDEGLGVVLKIEDGAQRALYPAAVEILAQLELLREAELEALAAYHKPLIYNWQGTVVGRIEPDFKLRSV